MGGLRTRIRQFPVVAYIVLAFAFSWTAWGLQFIQPDPMGTVGTLCFLIGGLGPLFAAGLVARLTGAGDDFLARLTRWRISPGWYLVAVLGPVLVLGGTVVLTQLLTAGDLALDGVRPLATLPGLVIAGVLLGGLEEPGWRGFAQEHLQQRYSAFVASILVGLLWICWHLPLFLLPGTAQSTTPVVPFAAMGLALAVVFASAYNSGGRSLPLVILLHGGFNGALGWSGLLEAGGGSEPMWAVAAALGVIAVAIVLLAGPGTLAYGDDEANQIRTASHEVSR